MGFLSNIFDAAKDNSVPHYTYDPATQQFSLAGQPATVPGPFGGIAGLFAALAGKTGGVPHFTYDPASQQYTRLASGGPVMNQAAQNTQALGRGQDTMLVHMSPNEVKGLQALAMAHGGSLTINPKTGLPEAGFLSSILPVVAGAALNFAVPGLGTALGGFAIPGIVGGATALATGSLGKGLMAGLGAYGGSGLMEGLAGAAGTAESIASATPAMSDALAAQEAALAAGQSEIAAQNAFNQTYVDKVTPFAKATGTDVLAKGLPALSDSAGRQAFMAYTPTGTLPTVGASLMSMMAAQPKATLPKRQAYIRPYDVEVKNTSRDFTPYTIGDSSERQMLSYNYSPRPIYAAAQGGSVNPDYNMETGGIAAFSDGYAAGGETGIEVGLDALAKKRKSLKGDRYYKFAQDRRDSSMEASLDQNFAAGGLPPRFLSGGGDGMSDSIKANIDGRQEARLADGEFVVPADVVSHLGNGSSKAGAKKLYSMMDKIRKARTGKTSQAPQVNAVKYMPA